MRLCSILSFQVKYVVDWKAFSKKVGLVIKGKGKHSTEVNNWKSLNSVQ